jgi:hypothetical protein
MKNKTTQIRPFYQVNNQQTKRSHLKKTALYLLIVVVCISGCATRATSKRYINEPQIAASIKIPPPTLTNLLTITGTTKIRWQNHAHDSTASNFLEDTTKLDPQLPSQIAFNSKTEKNNTITSVPVIMENKKDEFAFYTVKKDTFITLYAYSNGNTIEVLDNNILTAQNIHSTQPALFDLNNKTFIVVPGKEKAYVISLDNSNEIIELNYNINDAGQRIFIETKNNIANIYIQGITHLHYFTIALAKDNTLTPTLEKKIALDTTNPSKKLLPIIANNTYIFLEVGNRKICRISKTNLEKECKDHPEETISNLIISNDTLYYTSIKENDFLLHNGNNLFNNNKNQLTFNTNNGLIVDKVPYDYNGKTHFIPKDYINENCTPYLEEKENTLENQINHCIKTYSTKLKTWENQSVIQDNTYVKSASNVLDDIFYLGQTTHTALINYNNSLYFASNMGYSLKNPDINYTTPLINHNQQEQVYYSYNQSKDTYGFIPVEDTAQPLYKINSDNLKIKNGNTAAAAYNHYNVQLTQTIDHAITDSNNNIFAILNYRKDLDAIHFNNISTISEKEVLIKNEWTKEGTEYKKFVTDKLKNESHYQICLGEDKNTEDCSTGIIPTSETIKGLSVGNRTVYIITDQGLYKF